MTDPFLMQVGGWGHIFSHMAGQMHKFWSPVLNILMKHVFLSDLKLSVILCLHTPKHNQIHPSVSWPGPRLIGTLQKISALCFYFIVYTSLKHYYGKSIIIEAWVRDIYPATSCVNTDKSDSCCRFSPFFFLLYSAGPPITAPPASLVCRARSFPAPVRLSRLCSAQPGPVSVRHTTNPHTHTRPPRTRNSHSRTYNPARTANDSENHGSCRATRRTPAPPSHLRRWVGTQTRRVGMTTIIFK